MGMVARGPHSSLPGHGERRRNTPHSAGTDRTASRDPSKSTECLLPGPVPHPGFPAACEQWGGGGGARRLAAGTFQGESSSRSLAAERKRGAQPQACLSPRPS